MNGNTRELERVLRRIIIFGLVIYFFFMRFSDVISAFWNFIGVLMPFLLGIIISFIVNLPMTHIEGKLLRKIDNPKLKRALAVIISYIIVMGAFVVLMIYLVPRLIESFQTMRYRFPVFIDYLSNELKKSSVTYDIGMKLQEDVASFKIEDILTFINRFLKTGNLSSFNNVYAAVTTIFSTTFNVILAMIFSIYALSGKERLIRHGKKLIYTFLKEERADKFMHFLRVSNYSFRKFVGGRVIDAIIMGILCFIMLTIFSIPYSIVISIVVGFTNFVPIVGPFIGAIFGFIMIVIISPVQSLVFLAIILVLQQIDGNLIFPKIAGRSMGLPAIWTLLAVSVGGSLFGIFGVLLFVPSFNIIYTLLKEYSNKKLDNKKIDLEAK
ncbi:MAG: AI-2E family transporter [Tissierellia bacterium]|nr:AI-2E family transporter [Tissierellia bacterium]